MAVLAYFPLAFQMRYVYFSLSEMSAENSFISEPPSDISACKTLPKNMSQWLYLGSIYNLHNEQV